MTFVAESAASAPPPRVGPPLIPPPRASNIPSAGFEAGLNQAVAARQAAGMAAEAAEFDDEAQPVFYPKAEGGEAPALMAAGDEDGPPLDALEAQMLGEVSARDAGAVSGGKPQRRRVANDDQDAVGKAGPLPELDTLVARLPEEVRATLDELFRVRFGGVKQLPARVLAGPAARAGATKGGGN